MLASAGTHSIATLPQSASISSATISGSEVIEPWPISAPAERIVILPSGAMRTHGFTGALASVLACACDISRTPSLPTAMQNVNPPRPESRVRRESLVSIAFMAQASRAAPSMVTTFLPATDPTSVWHERCAVPSMCTVQAPHSPAPQPYLVPVNPTWSRIAHSNGVRGSASTDTCWLFKVNETMNPPLACVFDWRALRSRASFVRSLARGGFLHIGKIRKYRPCLGHARG